MAKSLASHFETYRPLLFGLAYRMLGTASEAEDIVQDVYLRAREVPIAQVKNAKAYLTTIATRLSLNRLQSASQQRETYLGPWLPEPVLTTHLPELTTPQEQMILHDSISIAFLTLLEKLSPAERAIFLLHEVFAYSYGEIGEMLEKSDAACRQLGRRARQHIATSRARFDSNPADHERLLQGFLQVVEVGDFAGFLAMLTEDVTLMPDGGGERGAAIRVLRGQQSVSQFMMGVRKLSPPNLEAKIVSLNGRPTILLTASGKPFVVICVYAVDGRIALIQLIAGKKLAHLRI
ncbi:RNA polymerase sigma factor SigJ [Candidatus Leptofilum sp.]|uniref:RNA polymerase sigma factor SigJ n=1 Tax=Candidatus Leptofilum sp. TaxID=3241576 RepID=UPI003B590FA3